MIASSNGSFSTESDVPDFTEFDNKARVAYENLLGSSIGGAGDRFVVGDASIEKAAQDLQEKARSYTAEVVEKNAEFAATTSISADTNYQEPVEFQYRGIYAKDR